MFGKLLEDFSFYFEVGGYVMPPLVVATVVLWFAIGVRFAILKRGSARSVRNIIRRHLDGPSDNVPREPRGMVEQAVEQGIAIARRGPENLRRLLDDAFWPLEREAGRFRALIYTIVAVAPLMGLLGTVGGMIETFDSLGDMSLFAQSGGIAGGISQALFTTQMGLAVAIPGLIVGGILDKRASGIRHDLAQVKDILCARSHAEQPV